MTLQEAIDAINGYSEAQQRDNNNNANHDYMVAQTGDAGDGVSQQDYDDSQTYLESADVDHVTDDINPNLNNAQLAGKNPCDRRPA